MEKHSRITVIKRNKNMPSKKHNESVLVRTLAVHQAPWFPIRQHWHQAPAICARRRGETPNGLKPTDGNRMRFSRERDDLQSRGLIGARDVLTEAGLRLARALVWPFTRSELAEAVDRMQAAVGRGDCLSYRGPTFVPEQLICGATWGEQVAMLQQCFLPLLCDGHIVSASESVGFAYYAQGDSVNLDAVIDGVVEDGVEFCDRMHDVYAREVKRCRTEMLGDANFYSELGELPIGARRLDSTRDALDLTGIEPLFSMEAATSE